VSGEVAALGGQHYPRTSLYSLHFIVMISLIIISPLDFLTGQPSPIVLTLALASLSGHITQNTLLRPILINDPDPIIGQILSAFIRFFWIMYASILSLPTVTCSASPLPIVGYVIGTVYTLLLIGYFILWSYEFRQGCLFFSTQVYDDVDELIATLIGIVPIFACLLGIVLWYVIHIVKEIVLNLKNKDNGWIRPYSNVHINSYNYTKSLFTAKTSSVNSNHSGGVMRILKKIYDYQPGFGYPLRVSVSIGSSFIVLFMLTFLLMPHFFSFGDTALALLNDSANLLNSSCILETFNNNVTDTLSTVLDQRTTIVNGITYYLITGPIIAFFLSLLQFIPILKNVRRHIIDGYRGNFVVPEGLKLSPGFIITSGMKYPGYQVGYMILGWVLYMLTVWLIGLLVLLLILSFIYAYQTFLLLIASSILLVSVNMSIHVLQFISGKFVFAKRIENLTVAGDEVTLTNRRIYNILSYLLYVYNGLIGFASAIMRSVLSAAIGLVYAPRMDTILLRNGHRYDRGYKVFLGFIQFELQHSNPIVHVFIDVVMSSAKYRKLMNSEISQYATIQLRGVSSSSNNDDIENYGVETIEDTYESTWPRNGRLATRSTIDSEFIYNLIHTNWPRTSQKAYNRWKLAVFLLRNPSLVTYRIHYNDN
jgi:hypothetical protein